jgi:hypothetical protein
VRQAALVIVLLAGVAAEARGHDDDRGAELLLAFDREGTGRITLFVPQPRGVRVEGGRTLAGTGSLLAAPIARRRDMGPRRAGPCAGGREFRRPV